MTELIKAWRDWAAAGATGVLPGDEVLLQNPKWTCHLKSWQEFVASDEWIAGSKRLHLGLSPVPYIGSLERARIYLLLLNPGMTPLDYFGEFEAPACKEIALDCLVQNEANAERGFDRLAPEGSWRGGFRYWHGKLAKVVDEFADATSMPFVDALAFTRRQLAAIELVPYHSAAFGLPKHITQRLRSVQLAQAYVRDVVIPKAERGEATVIVTRKVQLWNIPPSERVIVYSGGESRGAHLGPKTRGGKAILSALLEAAKP